MKITTLTNGPLLVEFSSQICDQNGRPYATQGPAKVALCRCGASADKPFCDGSHKRIGFIAPPQAPPSTAPAPPTGSNGGPPVAAPPLAGAVGGPPVAAPLPVVEGTAVPQVAAPLVDGKGVAVPLGNGAPVRKAPDVAQWENEGGAPKTTPTKPGPT